MTSFGGKILPDGGILSPYARVRTHDVILPPQHVTSDPSWVVYYLYISACYMYIYIDHV
jgi:hypothetical protein